MLLRFLEVLVRVVAFLAAVSMRVLRVLRDFAHQLLIKLLEALEVCAKWSVRMYKSIEMYARMFFVRMVWLCIQLLRLSIAFSPAIGAYIMYIFWPNQFLLWSAIGWTVLILISGIVLSAKMNAKIDVYTPTKQDFARMEYSITTEIFITAFRCMPGVLAIVFSQVAPMNAIVSGFCLWGGIVWAIIVVSEQAFISWQKYVEHKPAMCLFPPLLPTAQEIIERGEAQCLKGNYDQAIEDLDQAIGLDSQSPFAFWNRGVAHRLKGDYDQAIADYSRAIELNPKYALAYATRGAAYRLKGDYDQAIEDCNHAMELNPLNPFAFWNRGEAYRQKGNLNQAIADLSMAIRLDPKNPECLEWLAEACIERDEAEKAAQDRAEAERLRAHTA